MQRLFTLVLCCLLASGGQSSAGEEARASPGHLDGTWLWQLQDTPNGLRPYVSWHSTGSSPGGDIYVGGMDHVTNSALYRLEAGSDTLTYVGDARSASEAAGNWLPDETAEKFHTRPTWYDGKIYVATLDYSKIDAGYLTENRGAHWYSFNPTTNAFVDLGAAQPPGVGPDHLGVVTLAFDPHRDILYGMGLPTGDILQYDIATHRTSNLGRPANYDRPYLYVGRFMWVDRRGRLYFSAGNPSLGKYNPSMSDDYDPAVYGHIYYFDPEVGFGDLPDWKLIAPSAIETGQCLPGPTAERKTCFLADNRSRIYRFDDTDVGPLWSYIGQAVDGSDTAWVFQVSGDGKKAYFVLSANAPTSTSDDALFEFDIESKKTTRLCAVADIDPRLEGFDWHTGYDAWDNQGRFYFTSFPSRRSSKYREENAIVTAINPVRLKTALGLGE